MSAYNFGSQLLTLYTIRAYVKVNGFPPTKEELARLRGIHLTCIYTHLKQLEQRGYITRVTGWRNIRLTERAVA